MADFSDIVELLDVVGHVIRKWRVYLGLLIGVLLGLAVMHCVPDDTWSFILGIPIAFAGLVWGIIWHRRSD